MEAQTQTPKPRYCVACAHFRPAANHTGNNASLFGHCAAPDAPKTSPNGIAGAEFVAPALATVPPYASAMRSGAAMCGVDAKWFEVAQSEPKVAA